MEVIPVKKYKICRVMLNTIQSLSKDSTHEILGFIESEFKSLMLENKINIDFKDGRGLSKNKTLSAFYHNLYRINFRKILKYKNIDIPIRLCVRIEESDFYENSFETKYAYDMIITCHMASNCINYKEKDFDDAIIDGVLTGSSEPINKVLFKNIKNPIDVCMYRASILENKFNTLIKNMKKMDKLVKGCSIQKSILLDKINDLIYEMRVIIGEFITEEYSYKKTHFLERNKAEEEMVKVFNYIIKKNNLTNKKEILKEFYIQPVLSMPDIFLDILKLKTNHKS